MRLDEHHTALGLPVEQRYPPLPSLPWSSLSTLLAQLGPRAERLHPTRFFHEVAAGLDRVAGELPIAAQAGPLLGIDATGILADLSCLLRRAAAANGPLLLTDLPVLGRIPSLRDAAGRRDASSPQSLDDATTASTLVSDATTGVNPQALSSSGGGVPGPAIVGIFLIWRDLDESLWPDELRLIPELLNATLNLMFKQIEAQSRNTIRAAVFSQIQPTIDQATTLVMHLDLVIPSFIVELFSKDPDYRECVVLKGRTFLIGIPMPHRPVIRPLLGHLPNTPPGSPLVPVGRPLTAESLFADGAWRKFLDELERGFKNFGIDLVQTMMQETSKALVGHLVDALADIGSLDGFHSALDSELRQLTKTFSAALAPTPIDDLWEGLTRSVFGDAMRLVGGLSVDFFDGIIDAIGEVVAWGSSIAPAGAASTIGGTTAPLGVIVEAFAQLGEEIKLAIKGEAGGVAFGELVFQPVYEALFGTFREKLAGQASKGAGKLFGAAARAGFVTQTCRTECPPELLPAGFFDGGQRGRAFVLKKRYGTGKDHAAALDAGGRLTEAQHTITAGTVLVFNLPGANALREVAGVADLSWWVRDKDDSYIPEAELATVPEDARKEKRERFILLKDQAEAPGVGHGAIAHVPIGAMVLVATDYQAGMDAEYLDFLMAYHSSLELLGDFAADTLKEVIEPLFKDARAALAEDDPQAFVAKLESANETAIRDAVARWLGSPDFAALEGGTRRRILRTLPVGAIGGGRVELAAGASGAAGFVWTLPGADLRNAGIPTDDEDRRDVRLIIRHASEPTHNGEHRFADVVDADRLLTGGQFIQPGALGPATLATLVWEVEEKLDLMNTLEPENLRRLVYKLAQRVVEKLLSSSIEKQLDKLCERVTKRAFGAKLKMDDLEQWMVQETTRYGAFSGRTFRGAIDFHIQRFAGGVFTEMKMAQFLDFKTAIRSFAVKTQAATVAVPDPMAPPSNPPATKQVANPIHFDPAEIASDVTCAGVQELIARAFIISVVLGFELVGGQAKEGGGFKIDWASGLYLFNTIEGNRAQGSGDGGGVHVTGYLPNVFLGNEVLENSAKDRGGGVYLDRSLTAWVGNTIESNQAPRGGGVAAHAKAISLFAGNQLEKNRADDGGGLVSEARYAMWLGNVLSGNEASGRGGGALLGHRGTFLWNRFRGNRAAWGGGYACVDRCRAELSGNEVADNTASEGGGGAAVLGLGARPELATDRIHGNRAPRGGGVYVDAEARPELDGTRLSSNVADEEGGGLYVATGVIPVPKLSGVSLIGNRARRGGGAWFGRASGLLGCAVAANSAFESGGGLCVERAPSFQVLGSELCGNWADQVGGGAAFFGGGHVWIHASSCEDSRVFKRDGAGLYAERVKRVTLESSRLGRNFVDGGNGGGVGLFACGEVRLSGCELHDNGTEHHRGTTAGVIDAEHCAGGGAWMKACQRVTIKRSRFHGNGAERGGGAALLECGEVSVLSSSFHGNAADLNHDGFGLGGALFVGGAGCVAQLGGDRGLGNQLVGNTAGTPPALRLGSVADPQAHGGAIAVDAGPRAAVQGNHLHGNAATDLGGAIFFRDTAAGSVIGGDNDQPPPADPPGSGQRLGNRGQEGCAVEIEKRWPWEATAPRGSAAVLDGPDVAAGRGIRRLLIGLPDPGGVANAARVAQDEGGPLAALVVQRLDRLKQPLWHPWPALRDTSSDWNAPVEEAGLAPRWPPRAGWFPAPSFHAHQWRHTDSRPIYDAEIRAAPPQEIVTRRGGLFALVRGGGTSVIGNWFDRSYAVQLGGAGYVLESDRKTLIGRGVVASGADASLPSHANLFTRNVASLGGALALERTACFVGGNTFGDGAAPGKSVPGNAASAGGALFLLEATSHLVGNLIAGNLAGVVISPRDAERFPAELAAWVARGFLAFGGGVAVTGGLSGGNGPMLRDNVIRDNEILRVPDYRLFPATAPAQPPPAPVSAPPALPSPPAGRYLFGGGVALLETGSVFLLDNQVIANRIAIARAKLGVPLHLLGGGLGAVTVDGASGAFSAGGLFAGNRLELPARGLGAHQPVVLAGGGLAFWCVRRLQLSGAKILRNVVGRDLPGSEKTPPAASALRGGGVAIERGALVELRDSRVEGNALVELDRLAPARGGGAAIEDIEELTLDELVITGNWSHRDGGGLALGGTCTGKLARSTVADNECPSRGEALFLGGDASRLTLEGNLLRSFPSHNGAALWLDDGTMAPTLLDNAIDASTGPAIYPYLPGAYAYQPLRASFVDADAGDFRSSAGAASEDFGAIAADSTSATPPVPAPASMAPRLLRVPEDFPTIGEALRAAGRRDLVDVAPGRWHEAALEVPDEVMLRGRHGAAATFLEPPLGALPGLCFVEVSGQRKGTCVSGFTVRARPQDLGVRVSSAFRGSLLDLVIEGATTGVLVSPGAVVTGAGAGPGDAQLLRRAVIANVTCVRCETGVRFAAERVAQQLPPRDPVCRAEALPVRHERVDDLGDPILHHLLIEQCPVALRADRQQLGAPPVSSRFVARNDVHAGAVRGFVADLLELNDNTAAEPFLLPPPPPDEHHPTEGTGSPVLGEAWPDDHRGFGALPPRPRPTP